MKLQIRKCPGKLRKLSDMFFFNKKLKMIGIRGIFNRSIYFFYGKQNSDIKKIEELP